MSHLISVFIFLGQGTRLGRQGFREMGKFGASRSVLNRWGNLLNLGLKTLQQLTSVSYIGSFSLASAASLTVFLGARRFHR